MSKVIFFNVLPHRFFPLCAYSEYEVSKTPNRSLTGETKLGKLTDDCDWKASADHQEISFFSNVYAYVCVCEYARSQLCHYDIDPQINLAEMSSSGTRFNLQIKSVATSCVSGAFFKKLLHRTPGNL